MKPLEITFNSGICVITKRRLVRPTTDKSLLSDSVQRNTTSLVILTCLDNRLVLAAMPMIRSSFGFDYFI